MIGCWLKEKHPHGRGEDFNHYYGCDGAIETPPRAWGRLEQLITSASGKGNTPTGVGKTHRKPGGVPAREKHPHGRGEDIGVAIRANAEVETPPRAWGRLRRRSLLNLADGNTPTGVGKTGSRFFLHLSNQKHPHGRGEDYTPFFDPAHKSETPPRAWGRQLMAPVTASRCRNTPTGVGKTAENLGYRQCREKHPHGRGEDRLPVWLRLSILETPPRAWGRLQFISAISAISATIRNTPTGVGKTAV